MRKMAFEGFPWFSKVFIGFRVKVFIGFHYFSPGMALRCSKVFEGVHCFSGTAAGIEAT